MLAQTCNCRGLKSHTEPIIAYQITRNWAEDYARVIFAYQI